MYMQDNTWSIINGHNTIEIRSLKNNSYDVLFTELANETWSEITAEMHMMLGDFSNKTFININ